VICSGVMVEPASGCPEGHSCCRPCYVKELEVRKLCPTCRHPVAGEQKLVRVRPLEGMVSQLRLRCKHGEGCKGNEAAEAGPPAAKRARLAPAASMTVEVLRAELRQRGLDSMGNKPGLVARLEEDRQKDGGCRWRGRVGELPAHLGGECAWETVKCPNKGCTASLLRKELPAHDATCENRAVKCGHCNTEVMRRSLAEHEGRCGSASVECPNEGCSVRQQRWTMNVHRADCQQEEVTCPCPGCDARLLRKGIDAHVKATHLLSPEQQLQRLWRENARLQTKAESEQRLAAASPTSFIFNWRADGWGDGYFLSETCDLGDGVTGNCVFHSCSSGPERSYFIGYGIKGRAKCKVHVILSILDKHDKVLLSLPEIGTAAEPTEHKFTAVPHWGRNFRPTAEEKAQSERADGSIRLRAVVRLFLEERAALAAPGVSAVVVQAYPV